MHGLRGTLCLWVLEDMLPQIAAWPSRPLTAQQAAQGGTLNAPFGFWNAPGMFGGGSSSNSAATPSITSHFVNALRSAAKNNQGPDRDKQGLFGKLFGDLGSIGGMFAFI